MCRWIRVRVLHTRLREKSQLARVSDFRLVAPPRLHRCHAVVCKALCAPSCVEETRLLGHVFTAGGTLPDSWLFEWWHEL